MTRGRAASASAPGGERNPAASMALLDEVLDPPVGPGYYSAAQSRAARGLTPSSGSRTWLMFLVSMVVGMLCVVAATTLRVPNPAAAQTKQQLISRIEAAERAGDAERAQLDRLRGEILALEQSVSRKKGQQAGDLLAGAGQEAGAVAVRGPGIVVTLQDAAAPEEGAPKDSTAPERVNSRDLQFVVNGLWAAGAEAVEINGHRMTSTAAIRYAGEALVVDFRSLVPPYRVAAIGDPARLQAEATDGLTGSYLREIRNQYGLRTDVRREDSLVLAPAERLSTRLATVVEGGTTTAPPGSTPSVTPPTTPSIPTQTQEEGSR